MFHDHLNNFCNNQLQSHLYDSIHHNFEGFHAYFQPIYDAKRKCLIAAETLMRYQIPETGAVSPSVFIPILEKTKLIIPAGQWILQEAFAFCKKVQHYIPDFKISINLSAIQFTQGNICSEILDISRKYNINNSSIISELTESYPLETNPESTSHFYNMWTAMKEAGVALAIDDFGTGYSNFCYISDLDPHIIKLDRIFIEKALKHHHEKPLLPLFCDMLHKLDFEICIEGIETKDEMYEISKLNPDYIQGFYLGRPTPYKQFLNEFVFSKTLSISQI